MKVYVVTVLQTDRGEGPELSVLEVYVDKSKAEERTKKLEHRYLAQCDEIEVDESLSDYAAAD